MGNIKTLKSVQLYTYGYRYTHTDRALEVLIYSKVAKLHITTYF